MKKKNDQCKNVDAKSVNFAERQKIGNHIWKLYSTRRNTDIGNRKNALGLHSGRRNKSTSDGNERILGKMARERREIEQGVV